MKLECFELGVIGTNSYVLLREDNAILIDAGDFSIDAQLKFISNNGAKLVATLFTHGHFDHITGLEAMLKYNSNLPIYIGEEEVEFLEKPEYNLGGMFQMIISKKRESLNIFPLLDGTKISDFGILSFHMPGHTKGEMIFYIPEIKSCIVGDLIFAQGYGRTDLPTSNHKELVKSIQKLFEIIPADTTIYSGHGPSFVLKDWDKSQLF